MKSSSCLDRVGSAAISCRHRSRISKSVCSHASAGSAEARPVRRRARDHAHQPQRQRVARRGQLCDDHHPQPDGRIAGVHALREALHRRRREDPHRLAGHPRRQHEEGRHHLRRDPLAAREGSVVVVAPHPPQVVARRARAPPTACCGTARCCTRPRRSSDRAGPAATALRGAPRRGGTPRPYAASASRSRGRPTPPPCRAAPPAQAPCNGHPSLVAHPPPSATAARSAQRAVDRLCPHENRCKHSVSARRGRAGAPRTRAGRARCGPGRRAAAAGCRESAARSPR
jgi:hypothetical protein